MRAHRKKPFKKYTAGRRCFIFWGSFILLYMAGMLLPLTATPHYHNLTSRIWSWTEIMIMLLAVYYIIKTRTFRWKEAVAAMLSGAVCLVSLFRDPRTADVMVTGVSVAAAFYAACRLYELAKAENPSVHTGVAGGVRYFVLGAAISIPLALVNVLYFSLSRQIRVGNLLRSAVFALKPAVAEEVVFRFFLLAYAYYLFRGKAQTRFSNVCIYMLLTVPHDLLHYPDLFIKSPGQALVMCLLNGALFGFPMALLMKKKNLQMAVGMHWMIDFVRFAAGF